MAANERLDQLSTTDANNSPSGSDVIGSSLDDELRSIKANIARSAREESTATASAAATLAVTVLNKVVPVSGSAGGSTTITLPAAATAGAGFRFTAWKTDNTNNVIIDANGAETINGSANYTLSSQYEAAEFVTNGTSWIVKDTGFIKTSGGSMTGDLTFGDNDKAIFGDGSDLQIYHDASDSLINDNGTGSLKLQTGGSTKLEVTSTGIDVTGTVAMDGGSTSADFTFGDNDKALFGASSDLSVYHDGSNSYVSDTGTGYLLLTSDGPGVRINSSTAEVMGDFTPNGAATLYYDNSAKIATTSAGIDVTGTVTMDGGSTSADFTFGDNDKAVFGAGSDLQIFHDGSSSIISDQGTGPLLLRATDFQMTNAAGSQYIMQGADGGAVTLYHAGSAKIATTSGGINVTGTVTDDGATHDGDVTFTGASYNAVWDKSDNALEFADNARLQMGSSSDLSIYHDGSHSYIQDVGTGYLLFTSNGPGVRINSSTAEVMADFVPNGAVTLYYDNSAKIATTSSGVNVSGDAAITGALSKGSGSFKIDHPLPAKSDTHYLVHSFVEGPQADLIYRGRVDLVDGSAVVNIDTAAGMTDGTFTVLCTDVQCFTSNESGWTAVKGAVSGNTLTITAQDNTCTDTISWMVVGERKDAHMVATDWTDDNGRVIVEPLKPVVED